MSALSYYREARRQAPWVILAIVVLLLVLVPVLPLQWEAWSDDAAGIRQMLDYPDAAEVAWTTIILGVGAVVFALVLGILLALAVHSLDGRLQRFALLLPIAPLLIPSTAHVTGFVFLFSPEVGFVNNVLRSTPLFDHLTTGPLNIYTLPWIIAYTGFHLTSLVYLFVLNGLRQAGTTAQAAAKTNGAGMFRTFFNVTLPQLRPAILYSGIVVLLLSLGQLTAPLFLGRREDVSVIATEILQFTQNEPVNFGLGAAFSFPLLVFALVMVFAQRTMLQQSDRFVGLAEQNAIETTPRRGAQALAFLAVLGFAGISALLPLLALVLVGLSRFWSGGFAMDNATLDHFRYVLTDPAAYKAIVTTLRIALVSGLIVTVLGFVVAYVLFVRERFWKFTSALVDGSVTVALAVPAALFGFGFLFAYRQGAGYATEWGMVLAFVVITLPFAARYQLAGMVSVGRTPLEAATTSGAGLLRTYVGILAPLIRTSIAASAAIVLVLLTHEFGTAVMIRSPDTTVMSVKLYDFFTGALYPRVAVMGLVMTMVTAVVVILALIGGTVRRRR